MAISIRALERFLEAESPAPLPVRGAPLEDLYFCLESMGEMPPSKTVPRAVQLEGLVFALSNPRSLLFFDMRVGKTLIALLWIGFLRKNGCLKKPALVIAHSPLALGIWKSEAEKHTYLDVRTVSSGPTAEKVLWEEGSRADAVVVSWPTLQSVFSERRPKVRGEGSKFYPNLALIKKASELFGAAIIDEIHMSMDPGSLRFQIAEHLIAQCDWRLGLTGTPMGRNPYGLWAQFYLIDDGDRLTKNYYFFERAFGRQVRNPFRMSGYEYKFDTRRMPDLQKKIRDISLSCRLTDVHDVNVLPGIVELEMSKEQKKAYDDVVSGVAKAHSGSSEAVKNAFVRLRQISSGYRPSGEDDEKYVDFLEASKFTWAEEFFDTLDPEIKCVFFHEFVHTGERLGYILERKKIEHVRLWGGSRDREAYRRHFQQGSARVLVANVATGGVGADFSAADYLCFFESPPSVIARKQAEARPLGRGDRPLVLDDLICSPIERRILEFQKEGADIAALFRGTGEDVARRLRT